MKGGYRWAGPKSVLGCRVCDFGGRGEWLMVVGQWRVRGMSQQGPRERGDDSVAWLGLGLWQLNV